MEMSLEEYLLEAEGKNKEDISLENPYREIGFDGTKRRLGWVRVFPFSLIEEGLKNILGVIEGKKNFIFVGIGGSINGIKALLSLFDNRNIYTLDSLDPRAIDEIVSKIKDNSSGRAWLEVLDETLVISISKSGTTKETQLLSLTLKELFSNREKGDGGQDHFLWLADPDSFEKLDASGWKSAAKFAIQFDKRMDIGGRFSCPHTLIFYLPLFLLIDRDFNKLKEIYVGFKSFLSEIRKKAYNFSLTARDKNQLFLYPVFENRIGKAFYAWIVQLFQESLGSKIKDLSVKTLEVNEFGLPVNLNLEIADSVVYLMCQMCFFQMVTAFYAAGKSINFVNQDFVEKYKTQLRQLEHQERQEFMAADLETIVREVRMRVSRDQKFIEVVLYFYPGQEVIDVIRGKFRETFQGKIILVFIGSDWNHHSYQAAFADKDTYFVFLLAAKYKDKIPFFSEQTLVRNIETLKLISEATYLTLKNKACLFYLSA